MFRNLERRFGRFALHDLTLYLVGGQAIFFALSFARPQIIDRMRLVPHLAFAEPWRFLTFVFIPQSTSPIFVLFALYFFHMIGRALEEHWGAFRYNAYVLLAYLMTVVSALFIPNGETTNSYIAGSIFLAFAFLYPDYQLYIFFVLPVKVKWLAALTWLGYGYTIVVGDWSGRASVIASVANFLMFFGADLVRLTRQGKRHMDRQRTSISAKREEKQAYFHKCVTCGMTDQDDKTLQFRYVTDETGTRCYCMEHLRAAQAQSQS